MPNNEFFFNIKLLNNLKSKKITLFVILFIVLFIMIFFVNYNYIFKVIEGNNVTCKFSGNKKMEKDIDTKGKMYRDEPKHNRRDAITDNKNILNRGFPDKDIAII